jgi:hypothetical protein
MGCQHAQWNKTKNGKLHPNGNGHCTYPYKIPPLPASMHWIFSQTPYACGGYINRKEELKEDCVYYEKE